MFVSAILSCHEPWCSIHMPSPLCNCLPLIPWTKLASQNYLLACFGAGLLALVLPYQKNQAKPAGAYVLRMWFVRSCGGDSCPFYLHLLSSSCVSSPRKLLVFHKGGTQFFPYWLCCYLAFFLCFYNCHQFSHCSNCIYCSEAPGLSLQ